MMQKRQTVVLLIIAIVLACGSPAVQEKREETVQKKRPVMKMKITGEIAKSEHGYIIRGKEPSMILTILNPVASVLDGFVESEKIVLIETRIVSGDNVAIEKIDGREYPQSADGGPVE